MDFCAVISVTKPQTHTVRMVPLPEITQTLMFSDAETENTFQSHQLWCDPVPHRLLERQNCKQSYLHYNLQKSQHALSVAKTLELVVDKHWQRLKGSSGGGGWGVVGCWDVAGEWDQAMAETGKGNCWVGSRESWTIKTFITCFSISFCRTAVQRGQLNPSKSRSKERKIICSFWSSSVMI